MSIAQVIGIDPGLVHTGMVALKLDDETRTLTIDHVLVNGIDVAQVKGWCATGWAVYVEQYRPRQNLSADTRMLQAEQDLRRELPSARFLTNMGIKRVITQPLMEALEVWSFPTTSHHQDLRAAARIALLGIVKDDVTNAILTQAVRDHVDGRPWQIDHL